MASNPLVTPPNPQMLGALGANNPTVSWLFRFLTNVTNAINGSATAIGISQVVLGSGVTISSGAGSPATRLAGNIGDLYLNTSGGAGATLYVKESGAPGSNTGWQAK